MRALRALPFALFGTIAWFLWTTNGQSTGSCFSFAHYVPSAAIALAVIISVAAATDLFLMSRPQPPALPSLVASVLAAGSLTTLGLAAAVYFSAIVSCTGG